MLDCLCFVDAQKSFVNTNDPCAASNSNFDFFVCKQARNRAQGRAPPLKDALRKVARDLRARVRTNEDAKIRNADAPPLRLDFTGPFFDNALTSSYSRKG
jgi:hypothetical protein